MIQETDNKIKVIFYHIMRENFSGAQKNLYRLLINLDTKKIDPILLGQGNSPLLNLVSKKKIETMIVPFPEELEIYDQKILKFNPLIILRFIKGIYIYNKSLVKECKDKDPEIIWCDNIRTLITIYIACRVMKVRVIWNVWSEPSGKVAWILHRLGLLLADVINLEYKNQGKKVFGKLADYPVFNRKIVPLYTGVSDFEEITGSNIREELSLQDDDVLVVMASNIVSGKGQVDLIKSMELILGVSPNAHLLIAGRAVESSPDSIKYYDEIFSYVLKNNLDRNIHFIGWRSDVRDVLSKSDIYVSSSYSESLPDAVRDAMLASLPLVVSDVGGTSELVNIGENGYLFQPGDIINLTRYLKELILNSELRKKMGLKSRKIIDDRFSTKAYARNFEDMLKKTINS